MWLATLPAMVKVVIMLAIVVVFFVLWVLLASKLPKLHPGFCAILAIIPVAALVTWLHHIPAPS